MHGAPSVWLAEAGPQPRCVRALACCPAGLNACLEVRSQQSTGLHCHSKPLPLGGPGLNLVVCGASGGLAAVWRSGGLLGPMVLQGAWRGDGQPSYVQPPQSC